jgi:hypothetical protein
MTEVSIAQHLDVAKENILRGSTLPDNLHISVSCDEDRDQVSESNYVSFSFSSCFAEHCKKVSEHSTGVWCVVCGGRGGGVREEWREGREGGAKEVVREGREGGSSGKSQEMG